MPRWPPARTTSRVGQLPVPGFNVSGELSHGELTPHFREATWSSIAFPWRTSPPQGAEGRHPGLDQTGTRCITGVRHGHQPHPQGRIADSSAHSGDHLANVEAPPPRH